MSHQLTSLTVLRTLKNYMVAPRKALRLERREWGKYFCEMKARRIGLPNLFRGFSKWTLDPDWADLWNMYTLVKNRNPKIVLEFGSGCSTLVMAQALHDVHKEVGGEKGTLYSIDESEYWSGQVKKNLPSNLKNYCEMMQRESDVVEIDGVKTKYHKNVPNLAPNFVYIDGPLVSEQVNVVGAAVLLEEKAPSDYFVLIDGLHRTYNFTKSHLKRRYKATRNTVYYYSTFEPIN
mgnify:CR=1 FL=1